MVMHTGQVFRQMPEPALRFLSARYLVAYLDGYLVATCGEQRFCRSQAAARHREAFGKEVTLASARTNMPS